MRYSMQTACVACPFRSDIQPYLPIARVRQIVQSITVEQQTFSCHKTNDFDDDGNTVETPRSQHCAGAMAFLLQRGQPNQMMRIAMRLGMFDPDGVKADAPIYRSLREWEKAIRERGIFVPVGASEGDLDEDE